MVHIEIEKKYVVDALIFAESKPEILTEYKILQGYFSADSNMRVRVVENTQNAYITFKGSGTISRKEYEYSIPYDDGLDLYDSCKFSIQKKRIVVAHAGKTWEVDVFNGALFGLVVVGLYQTFCSQAGSICQAAAKQEQHHRHCQPF